MADSPTTQEQKRQIQASLNDQHGVIIPTAVCERLTLTQLKLIARAFAEND